MNDNDKNAEEFGRVSTILLDFMVDKFNAGEFRLTREELAIVFIGTGCSIAIASGVTKTAIIKAASDIIDEVVTSAISIVEAGETVQ